jgi:hypothetical protein
MESVRERIKAEIINSKNAETQVASSYWVKHLESYDSEDPLNRNRDGKTNFPGLASYSKVPIPRILFEFIVRKVKPRGLKLHNSSPALKAARNMVKMQKRHFDFDVMKHVFVFEILQKFINPKSLNLCVIGDGLGNFVVPALQLRREFNKVISINLPEVLLADLAMIEEFGFSESQIRVVVNSADLKCAMDDPDIRLLLVSAQYLELLYDVHIDIFVNIASMQEMNLDVIEKYFSIIKSARAFFYCLNRAEKILPDGTVTKFGDYPWGQKNSYLLGPEACPFYEYAFKFLPPFRTKFPLMLHALVKY